VPGQATRVGHVIKPALSRGYHRLSLHVGLVQLTRSVHRLVAETFLGPIPKGMQINHRNGVKTDNRVENLEICTPAGNSSHRTHVLCKQNPPPHKPGAQNGRAKLTDADVPAILAMRATGASQQKIADHFGVHQTNISKLLLGKTGFQM